VMDLTPLAPLSHRSPPARERGEKSKKLTTSSKSGHPEGSLGDLKDLGGRQLPTAQILPARAARPQDDGTGSWRPDKLELLDRSGWKPFRARLAATDEVFQGWWSRRDDLILTLCASPPPRMPEMASPA